MRQLVGLSCAICRERIPSDLDGRFCATCGCPVHTKCDHPALPTGEAPRCAACGAPAELREREQALHQEHEARRKDATGWRNPRLFLAGMVGFGIMTVSACNATLNPVPDGRVLNTTPALGFDVFLPIGLLGMGYCVVRWLMSR